MDSSLKTLQDIDDAYIVQSVECSADDLHKYSEIQNNNSFKIVAQNIRSIYCNLDNVILTMFSLGIDSDIIILTECRLNSDKQIPNIQNYTNYCTTKLMNQNDGVVAYIRNTIQVKVNEISLSHAIKSSLQITTTSYIILAIYRSPSNYKADEFISSLNIHLESIKSINNICITSDININ